MIRKIRTARMATKLLLATAVALLAFGGVFGRPRIERPYRVRTS